MAPNEQPTTPPKAASAAASFPSEPPPFPAQPFLRAGAPVDAFGAQGEWQRAEVAEVNTLAGTVRVRFVYCPDAASMWIAADSPNLLPSGAAVWQPGSALRTGHRVDVLVREPARAGAAAGASAGAGAEEEVWRAAVVVDAPSGGVVLRVKGSAPARDLLVRLPEELRRLAPYESRTRSASASQFSLLAACGSLASGGGGSSVAGRLAGTQPRKRSRSNFGGRTRRPALTPLTVASQTAQAAQATMCSDIAAGDGQLQQVMDPRVLRFVAALEAQNLRVAPMGGDGNCLFRSVAHQVYGDEELHPVCRAAAASYMEAEAHFFSEFVVDSDGGLGAAAGTGGSGGGSRMLAAASDATTPAVAAAGASSSSASATLGSGSGGFAAYLSEIRRDGVWGDDPEVQALSEIYGRPTEVWAYDSLRGAKLIRVFGGPAVTASSPGAAASATASVSSSSDPSPRPPIRLSYFGGGHYDSVVHRTLWSANLIARERAGRREEQMVLAARQRNLQRASVDGRVSAAAAPREANAAVGAAISESDREATELATLQAAIDASRVQWEASHYESVDAALLASLGVTEPPAQSFAAPSSAAEDDERRDLAGALMRSASEAESKAGTDLEGELVEAVRLESMRAFGASSSGSGMALSPSALVSSATTSAVASAPATSASSAPRQVALPYRPQTDADRLFEAAASLTEDEQVQCLLAGLTPEQFIAARNSGAASAPPPGQRSSGDEDLDMALFLSSQFR